MTSNNLTEAAEAAKNGGSTLAALNKGELFSSFDVDAFEEAYEGPHGVPGGIDPTSFATGPMLAPDPDERGFKDTVKANPGYFTTIRAKFDLPEDVIAPQTYVHHCHIVEHEDNDMMRPFTVEA